MSLFLNINLGCLPEIGFVYRQRTNETALGRINYATIEVIQVDEQVREVAGVAGLEPATNPMFTGLKRGCHHK